MKNYPVQMTVEKHRKVFAQQALVAQTQDLNLFQQKTVDIN